MPRMTTSTLSTSPIEVKEDDIIDRYGVILEIWWADPQGPFSADQWKNSDFLYLYTDIDDLSRHYGLLIEKPYNDLSERDWTQIQTLEELPLRFNYKDHKNLTLPELIKVVVSELTTPTQK